MHIRVQQTVQTWWFVITLSAYGLMNDLLFPLIEIKCLAGIHDSRTVQAWRAEALNLAIISTKTYRPQEWPGRHDCVSTDAAMGEWRSFLQAENTSSAIHGSHYQGVLLIGPPNHKLVCNAQLCYAVWAQHPRELNIRADQVEMSGWTSLMLFGCIESFHWAEYRVQARSDYGLHTFSRVFTCAENEPSISRKFKSRCHMQEWVFFGRTSSKQILISIQVVQPQYQSWSCHVKSGGQEIGAERIT